MKKLNNKIKERKADHIEICLKETVQASKITTGFEDVLLVHKAIPELDRQKIDISTKIFDYNFSAPFFVGAMTGGTDKATKINIALAEAVEELHIGMGVGSQRIAIDNPNVEHSFSVVREKAPTAFILANIGGPQLVSKYGVKEAKKAIKMVKANALAIHLNPLQEAIQPEGETNYSNLLESIGRLTKELDVPVIIKETGSGISSEDATLLEEAGVAGIDIAGAGGTSWSAVEYYRSKTRTDSYGQRLGLTFWDWGISTAASLVETISSVDIPIIASGGIRNGIEIVKAMALGAKLVSATYPFLYPATKSSEDVKKAIQYLIEEVKNTMFLVGADSIEQLKNTPVVLTGKTAEWLKTRGFKPEIFARRKP